MVNTNKLRTRIRQRKMTVKELAELIGISAPSMSGKIHNRRPFTLEEAERVASALDIPDEDFSKYFFANFIA